MRPRPSRMKNAAMIFAGTFGGYHGMRLDETYPMFARITIACAAIVACGVHEASGPSSIKIP